MFPKKRRDPTTTGDEETHAKALQRGIERRTMLERRSNRFRHYVEHLAWTKARLTPKTLICHRECLSQAVLARNQEHCVAVEKTGARDEQKEAVRRW
jgi:hypothetical protein